MTAELLAIGCAFALVMVPRAWSRTRHLVTLVHEAGHGGVAILTRRRLRSIRLHHDTSGLTVTSGRPSGLGMVATAAAGYLAPSVVGLVLALLVIADRTAAAVWLAFVLVAFVLMWIRNGFGLLLTALAGIAMAILLWGGSIELQSTIATGIAAFLLLAAPRSTLELWGHRGRRRSGTTDADVLGRITWLPAVLWCLLFNALTISALLLGIWFLLPR